MYILIMVFATSMYTSGGITSLSVEFNSFEACNKAGMALMKSAVKTNTSVRTWGCFDKGM